jgi:Icc-related predicted phosphoesterase
MKVVAISDTHSKHEQITLPKGDMLIHAGDVSSRGGRVEIETFLNWFSRQNFEHKIFIAGNHDFYFENATIEGINNLIPENVTYLNDSGITINGINIWGSPISPWFYDWAFNRHRGAPIKKHWDLIPTNTNILITHGPVAGIHDKTVSGEHVGCQDLLDAVKAIKPSYHVCGHIHEAYGQVAKGDTTFINASVLNEKYIIKNPAITFKI